MNDLSLLHIVLIYLVIIRSNLFACQSKNVATFFVYGIDKWRYYCPTHYNRICPMPTKDMIKLIIIDSSIAYVGSANLTGAGMGMKSLRKRNFEAGILTDDPEMVEATIEQFDNVWIGKFFASSSINAARIVAVESIVQTR